MADKKISALTAAALPLAGTEVLPIVQSGATVKVASNDLTVKNVRSNATTGILQIVGPAASVTRVMTTPNANFTAARTDAAQSFTGDQTFNTGNLIQGTAARGFNFTANTPAAGMTSQLLNWYEQGTWTPTPSSDGTPPTFSPHPDNSGTYTRVGNIVIVHCTIRGTISSVGTGTPRVAGLPFAASVFASPSFGLTNILTGAISSAYMGVSQTYVILNGPVWNTSAGAYLMMTLVYRV